MKVVRLEYRLRVSVCVIEAFTISARLLSPFMIGRFSRIRSKMTIVALIEYPKIVSITAIKVLPTDARNHT